MRILKCLDVFCGLGGWSKGFASEGFDCTGVDIVNVGYPYKLILQDIKTLDPSTFQGFNIIVGSPPCRDFSIANKVFRARWWKNPPDPQAGLELVNAFLNFVEAVKPKFWLMENVSGLEKYIGPPKVRTYLAKRMLRCFWGEFPSFLVPFDCRRPLSYNIKGGKMRSWLRAEIPFPVAQAFAQAVKDEISVKASEESK